MNSHDLSTNLSTTELPAENGSVESQQLDEFRGLLERLAFALGPLGTGLILDLLDVATFGPVGLFLGARVGGFAGWILGRYEGFERNLRIAFAVCAAAYMMIPLTEPVPAATVLLLLARFFVGPRVDADSGRDVADGQR